MPRDRVYTLDEVANAITTVMGTEKIQSFCSDLEAELEVEIPYPQDVIETCQAVLQALQGDGCGE